MQSVRRFWVLGWYALFFVFTFGLGVGDAREAWGRSVATTPVATTSVVKSPVAKSLTQLITQLNRFGRRYGKCGRDRWSGAVGDQGALRLKRSYQATTPNVALFGRAAHKCALLRSHKRFDRETIKVNAHDLGMVGVSVKRGVVLAYCRRREYECVRASELGSGEISSRRWVIRMGRNPDGLRHSALALQRLIRSVQRDPRYARPKEGWHRLRQSGRIMRGAGIGVTIAGIAGTIAGGVFAGRIWPRGPCGDPLASLGCDLSRGLAILAVLTGVIITTTGMMFWGTGQRWLDQAREREMQAPLPKSSAALPSRRRSGPTLPTSMPATFSLGWTFRF